MTSGWTVTRNDVAPIHTFTASEDGWLVNSHVIEFPSQLFVIDAQYTLPNAREVVGYARNLRKPMTRLIVTHYHPDHILGAATFDVPLYALESVAERINAVGDRVAQEEHKKVGPDIPATVRRPDKRIAVGNEIVDGVRLELRRLKEAETEDALTIALPDAGAIIVQDLVYQSMRIHFSVSAALTAGVRRCGPIRRFLTRSCCLVTVSQGAKRCTRKCCAISMSRRRRSRWPARPQSSARA